MREFFRPWRRKIGVLTLVLACVLMAGWLRNVIAGDFVELSIGNFRVFYLSYSGRVDLWIKSYEADSDLARMAGYWSSNLSDIEAYFASHSLFYEWNSGGISVVGPVRISYWLITIPLTALSAFLLLSKPRQSNQMKILEPISNEGA